MVPCASTFVRPARQAPNSQGHLHRRPRTTIAVPQFGRRVPCNTASQWTQAPTASTMLLDLIGLLRLSVLSFSLLHLIEDTV